MLVLSTVVHVLEELPFTTSKTELDYYYYQKVIVCISSQVSERPKI